MVDPALCRVAQEFDLGEPLEQEALGGGSAPAFRLHTSRGQFVVKDGGDERELALYRRVEETLNSFVKAAARILFIPILLSLEADRPVDLAQADKRATAMENILACRDALEATAADL